MVPSKRNDFQAPSRPTPTRKIAPFGSGTIRKSVKTGGIAGGRTIRGWMTHNAAMTSRAIRFLTPRRLVAAGLVVVLAVILGSLALRGPAPLPAAVNPLLPDLVMGPIEEVRGGLAEFTQAPVVRVEATIVNKGAGDFLVSARRDWPWSDSWTVYQRLPEAGGGYTESATAADLVFTGVPHSHWHVKNMEAHRLERLDTGEVLSEVMKEGFCPYDTDLYDGELPRAPANPVYVESDCEGPVWVTSLTMGVSSGWGDKYPWHMVEQNIDITGVPDGIYRIREIADPNNWFEESDETNNETWVDVEIKVYGGIPTVKVVDGAPQP